MNFYKISYTFEKSIKNLFIKPVFRYVDRFLPFLIFKFSKNVTVMVPSMISFFFLLKWAEWGFQKPVFIHWNQKFSFVLSKWCTQRDFRPKTIRAQKICFGLRTVRFFGKLFLGAFLTGSARNIYGSGTLQPTQMPASNKHIPYTIIIANVGTVTVKTQRILDCLLQCSGSATFWDGSGSSD